jgi:hypothetical protein
VVGGRLYSVSFIHFVVDSDIMLRIRLYSKSYKITYKILFKKKKKKKKPIKWVYIYRLIIQIIYVYNQYGTTLHII